MRRLPSTSTEVQESNIYIFDSVVWARAQWVCAACAARRAAAIEVINKCACAQRKRSVLRYNFYIETNPQKYRHIICFVSALHPISN